MKSSVGIRRAVAIQHTRSGQGGQFEVLVWRGRASACVAVIDDGARHGPAPRSPGPGDLAESGHGLHVVAEPRPAGVTETLPRAYPAAPSGSSWPGTGS